MWMLDIDDVCARHDAQAFAEGRFTPAGGAHYVHCSVPRAPAAAVPPLAPAVVPQPAPVVPDGPLVYVYGTVRSPYPYRPPLPSTVHH